MILVSSCLAGLKCRYNGMSSGNQALMDLVAEGKAIPVCPEQMGGAPTPRPCSEIEHSDGAAVLRGEGRVISKEGHDITAVFIRGAEEVAALARNAGARTAVLKARSPSCGCGQIYDGTFSGVLVPGNGVTAQKLIEDGVAVFTEETWKNPGA